MSKARLDEALGSLVGWVATNTWQGGLELDGLSGPFQPKPFYGKCFQLRMSGRRKLKDNNLPYNSITDCSQNNAIVKVGRILLRSSGPKALCSRKVI